MNRRGVFSPTPFFRLLGGPGLGRRRRRLWVLAVRNHILVADESGTHDQAVATLVAGYLATVPRWEAFEVACLDAHRKGRLRKPFHMTDFLVRKHPDYRHLSPAERQQLIHRLESGIVARKKTGFVGVLLRRDYDRVLLPETKKHIHDPYVFCLQLLLKIVLSVAPTFIPFGDRISVAFEQKPKFRARGQAAYQEMRAYHDPHGYLMPTCGFFTKEELPQLVAADILANCSGRFVRRPGIKMVRRDDPTLYRLLTSRRLQHHWKVYDAPQLEEIQDRLIAEGRVRASGPRRPGGRTTTKGQVSK